MFSNIIFPLLESYLKETVREGARLKLGKGYENI